MAYTNRAELLRQIEANRERPAISFVTSLRPNAGGQIAGDVIPEFVHQLRALPRTVTEIDLLVVSNGGDPIAAWRIASLLRERFDRYNVLLPYSTYSAATLLALGADKIIMHPFASIGPVDPQLAAARRSEDGRAQHINQFGAEDLVHFFSFVRDNVGITDQEQLEKAFELLCTDVGALAIGNAKRSSQLMLSLSEKLLSLHMDEGSSKEARTIAESLNRSYYHHGYSVGPREAKELRLKVEMASEPLQDLMWQVWQDFSDEMKCSEPFDPMEIALADPKAANALSSAKFVTLPTNLPPQLMQQVFNQILQQVGVYDVVPVDFSVFYAAVESANCYSHFRQEGEIRAVRLPDLNIQLNVTSKSQRWKFCKNSLSG